ncbi:MAG: histidine kinase, partial [Dehalococcoidia bacterium]
MTDKTVAPTAAPGGLLDRSSFTVVPRRLKERPFWITQLLIIAAVGTHYVAEVLGATNPYGIFHGMSITAFVIPMVYASLAYGWEGAVFTAFWAFALIMPSMGIFHRDPDHWGAETVQLGTTLPVGLLVAWRVGKEKALTHQLERRADALELLNSVASRLGGSAGVRERLPQVLAMLVSRLRLDSAWLLVDPAPGFSDETVLFLPDGLAPAEEGSTPVALHQLVAVGGRSTVNLDGTVVAIRVASDTNYIGSLGVRSGGRVLEEEELNLLATVARQVGVSIRNIHLQLASQENLRSYAHQVTQAQEEERLRISQELHDVTAQELIELVRTIEGRRESGTTPDAADLAALAEQVRRILEGVRRYARNLR